MVVGHDSWELCLFFFVVFSGVIPKVNTKGHYGEIGFEKSCAVKRLCIIHRTCYMFTIVYNSFGKHG